jgi:hypothetical protein
VTNRELFNMPPALLDEAERRRLYLLRLQGQSPPCPACRAPVSGFDAAGVTLEDYDFGTTKRELCCPGCGCRLEAVLTFVPGYGHRWHWGVQPAWLRERLAMARAFDRVAPPAAAGDLG